MLQQDKQQCRSRAALLTELYLPVTSSYDIIFVRCDSSASMIVQSFGARDCSLQRPVLQSYHTTSGYRRSGPFVTVSCTSFVAPPYLSRTPYPTGWGAGALGGG